MRPFLRGLSTTEATLFEGSTDPNTRAEDDISKLRSRNYRISASRSFARRSRVAPPQAAIEMEPLPTETAEQASGVRTLQLGRRLSRRVSVGRDSISSGSNESQHMIIRKDVTWTVDHDAK